MLNKDHRNRAPVHILLEAKLDWEEGQGIQLGPELASSGGQVAHNCLFKDCWCVPNLAHTVPFTFPYP